MAFFAMVVVVEAPDPETAWNGLSKDISSEATFVGGAWQVSPVNATPVGRVLVEGYDPEFSTDAAIKQRERN